MKRQLQIKDGRAQSEWCGSGGMPVPPDASWTFVDVTDRPAAQVGMIHDARANTFTDAPIVVREPAPAPIMRLAVDDTLRADIRAIKAKLAIP